MIENNSYFLSDGLSLAGRLLAPVEDALPPGVLFLHGSGIRTGKEIFASWQSFLVHHGFATFSFDCRGVGESEGQFFESTLENRKRDALAALTMFIESGTVDPGRIALVANSMGGHTAAILATDPRIKAVVLYAAAAYGQAAESIPLDSVFTTTIRQENSWQDSKAFASLAVCHKPILVIYPEHDTVIPVGVQTAYRNLAAASGQSVIIPQATHASISETTDIDRALMRQAFAASLNFLHNRL